VSWWIVDVMDIRPFRPDDLDEVRAYVEMVNAVRRVDAPWVFPMTEHECRGMFRHGWDGEPSLPFLAYDDGRPVARAEYATSTWDNKHLAWLDVSVHPELRRRGFGTAVLDALLDRARGEGRTSIGIDGWESASTRAFATANGLEQKAVEVNRRQHLAEVDHALVERLHGEAAAHASAYELVRRVGYSPTEELDALARMTAAINDAPTDDLDIEDEVFTAERIRAYEHAQVERGYLLHRLVARHRETGELAGQTVVAVDTERPELAEQHDTSVVAAHRGHRLGLLLKAEMLRWLREEQPQVESVDTWNSASNDRMIGVNELLGYRVMGRALAFQRTV
jgi:GNAT superfamily N-acetyltransferase